MAIHVPDMLTPGNIVAENPESLRLLPEHLARHIFIAGGSGGGKTKLIELLSRQLINRDWGFTYIDPHGDGVDALVQYLATRTVDPRRVHLLRPGGDYCFSFDPFAGLSDGPIDSYEGRLDTAVDRVVRAFLRNVALADLEVMKRLRRWLKNVLTACAIDVDGKHLGISHALALTNPKRDHFVQIMDRIGPALKKLKPDVYYDLKELQDCKSDTTRNTWTESTINCLRDILGVAVRKMFGCHAPSLDLKDVILNRGIQLVNLRESDDLSRDQANVVGGLLINFLVSTARKLGDILAPEKRVPHYVIIDEAENFIGEDLRMGFAELRKFGLSLCIAFQDLNCLRKGDLDLVSKVVENCGLQFTFCQQDPDNVEYLAKAFKYGNLDLTPLMINEVLPNGYERIITTSVSVGDSWQHSVSHGENQSVTHADSIQRQTGESVNKQVSMALSCSDAVGQSLTLSKAETNSSAISNGNSSATNITRQESFGDTANQGVAKGESGKDPNHLIKTKSESAASAQSHLIANGIGETSGQSHNKTDGTAETASAAVGNSQVKTSGETITIAGGKAVTSATGDGQSDAVTAGESEIIADARGGSTSIARTETYRPLYKITEKVSGKTVVSVQDQLAFVMNQLASLPDRMMLVKCKGMGSPFLVRVHEVIDAYEEKRLREDKKVPYSPQWRESDLRQLWERIRATHSYFFVSSDGDAAAKLEQFLELEIGSDNSGRRPIGRRTADFMEQPADKINPFEIPKKP